MASFCRSAAAAARSLAFRSRSRITNPFPATRSPVAAQRLRRSAVKALAGAESLMPLHSAVAGARLRSCIAADASCWSCLSQVTELSQFLHTVFVLWTPCFIALADINHFPTLQVLVYWVVCVLLDDLKCAIPTKQKYRQITKTQLCSFVLKQLIRLCSTSVTKTEGRQKLSLISHPDHTSPDLLFFS
ncbi:hypothetical protein ACQ4PT_059634 [Festuca glaucescens]